MQAVSFRCTYQVARMEHHWSILSGLRERKRMLDDEETLAISAKAQSCSFFFFFSACSVHLLHISLNYADMVGEGRRGIIIRRLPSFVSLLV